MIDGITTCPQCKVKLIEEELPIHKCDINYKFDGDSIWIRYEGKWYQHFLPLNNRHSNRDTQEDDRICDWCHQEVYVFCEICQTCERCCTCFPDEWTVEE